MAQTIDAPNSSLDVTTRIFDSFYNLELTVDANQYEIINSYFASVCSSPNAAKNFTAMIFRIASVTGENPMVLLEYMQGTSKVEASALMIYYLNSIKSKTALYGVGAQPAPNLSVQRNVLI